MASAVIFLDSPYNEILIPNILSPLGAQLDNILILSEGNCYIMLEREPYEWKKLPVLGEANSDYTKQIITINEQI